MEITMHIHNTIQSPKFFPIIRFHHATIFVWTLLAIITTIWECNDNMEFKATIAQSISRASRNIDVTILIAELEHAMFHNNVTHVAIIAAIWLMGLWGIRFGFRTIRTATTSLVTREREFRTLTETLPDNIARYDLNCRILYVNPVLEKTLGMSLESVEGKIPTVVHPAGQYGDYMTRLRKVLANGVDSEMEMLLPDGEGGILYHHIKLVAEFDHDGSIVGALTIGRDITESKRMEKQQAAREREFRALVDNSPDTIVRYDQFCRRVYVNPAMEQLAGKSAELLTGRTPSEVSVATAEVGRQVQDAVQEVLDHGVSQEIELTWKDSGGTMRHFHSRYAPEFDANGEVASVISITRDITTLRSTEAQLQHVQKMESIGLLAGSVAHDFNNILSVIGGYAELLKLTIKGNEEKQTYVQEITNSVFRGAELTRSLLTFSGKHEPRKQYDNINLIVANLQKSMSRLLRSDISLSFELCDDSLPVLADRVQIDQVLINLMVNARDALASGGRICVGTALVEVREDVATVGAPHLPGSYALVTVKDNGVGMDTETVGRIFDPFFTTKESGKGTGLGLAIVFGIVGNHGGHIFVESTPGNGSVFRIYLPIYKRYSLSIDLPKLETAGLRGNETVLLADDEPNLLKIISKMLERYGYAVLTAADGAEALQVFEAKRNEIQVVIIDMIMPRMNGREVIARIRQQKPDLPIILTSGYTDVVFDDPDIHFMPKPIHFKKLTETLRAALGRTLSVKSADCFTGEEFMHQPDLLQIATIPASISGDLEADDWL